MNTQSHPASAQPKHLPAAGSTGINSALHQRATLDGLDVTPLRFELWLLAGGERRRVRRSKHSAA